MLAIQHASSRPRIGIAGATGYAGQELVRLVARHPSVDLVLATSSGHAEPRRLPALARMFDDEIGPLDVEGFVRSCDVVFMALPDKAAALVGGQLAAAGLRIIDLSGAFRLTDDDSRRRWYPDTGLVPPGTVYGLPERDRTSIASARLVACPGCYPTAALLALAPLASASLLTGHVVIDAKSGLSGAGKAPSDRTHFSENHGSAAAYGVFHHRHTAEMEQELGRSVTFVPHLVPLNRGILETIYAHLTPGTGAGDVARTFEDAYADCPMVRLRGSDLPEIKHVAHTPFCDIGWRVDAPSGRIVLVSCLDNLLKGAASQAVQSLNLIYGLGEIEGLL